MKDIFLCFVCPVGRCLSSKDTTACPLLVDGGYWESPLGVRHYYVWRALLYPSRLPPPFIFLPCSIFSIREIQGFPWELWQGSGEAGCQHCSHKRQNGQAPPGGFWNTKSTLIACCLQGFGQEWPFSFQVVKVKLGSVPPRSNYGTRQSLPATLLSSYSLIW